MSNKPTEWTDERVRGPWVRSRYGFQILTRGGYSVCELKSVGNENMQIAIADMIARAPTLQGQLDAANQRIDCIYNDGLEDFTEADLERYSQLSPPKMYRAMKVAQQRVAELEGECARSLYEWISLAAQCKPDYGTRLQRERYKQLTGRDYDEGSEGDE